MALFAYFSRCQLVLCYPQEHLLQPSETSLYSSTSAALDARPTTRTATGASAASPVMPNFTTASTGTPGDDSDSDSTPPGRTPVFLLPGVTLSLRSGDGTLLRLRPAFLSLQQLATALTLSRDAAVVAWRRQRSEQRWKLASALDVLTVHFAGRDSRGVCVTAMRYPFHVRWGHVKVGPVCGLRVRGLVSKAGLGIIRNHVWG